MSEGPPYLSMPDRQPNGEPLNYALAAMQARQRKERDMSDSEITKAKQADPLLFDAALYALAYQIAHSDELQDGTKLEWLDMCQDVNKAAAQDVETLLNRLVNGVTEQAPISKRPYRGPRPNACTFCGTVPGESHAGGCAS